MIELKAILLQDHVKVVSRPLAIKMAHWQRWSNVYPDYGVIALIKGLHILTLAFDLPHINFKLISMQKVTNLVPGSNYLSLCRSRYRNANWEMV